MDRLKSIVLAVCAVVMAVSVALPAVPVSAEGSAALGWPPRKDYTVKPGAPVNDTIVLSNRDRQNPLHLNLRVIDFTYHDETGTPKLMLDEDAAQTAWSLKPFIDLPETVTVEPGSTRTIDVSVNMPGNYRAGEYYSAIVYSSAASEGGNVGLNASGVTLVFAKIPGEVSENLVLEKLGTYDSGAEKYTYFNSIKPTQIAYTLRNEGNVTGSPVGSITLKNWFGHEVTINDINPNDSLALIDQTRTFEACILLKKDEVDFAGSRTEATTCAEPTLWPGYYSVNLDAFYSFTGGNVTKELAGSGGFWYLPWWFVLATLAVLAYAGYHIWRFRRYIRRKRGHAPAKKRSIRRK